MAKFDNIIKYLGKEDSFSPDEIIKGIESEGGQGNIDDLSSLTSQNMENVEKLIKDSTVGSTGGSAAAAPAPVEEIDADLLREIENLDTAPPKIEDLEKPFEGAENEFLTEPSETPSEPPEPSEPAGLGEAPSLMEPQFMEMPSLEETAEPRQDAGMETGAEPEMPEIPGMPESAEGPKEEFEFPDFNTPSAGGEVEAVPETPMPEFELPHEEEAREAPVPEFQMPPESAAPENPMPDFQFPSGEASQEAPEIPDFQLPQESATPETSMPDFQFPSDETPRGTPENAPSAGPELGGDDALRIRDKINKISNPVLRKKVRQIILESKIPQDALKQMISMLLGDAGESRIRILADSYLPDSLVKEKEERMERPPSSRRRVIYTEEAKRVSEFRRDFTGAARYFFAFIIFIIVFVICIWQMVWIPFTASLHYNRGLAYFKVYDYEHAEQEFDAGKNLESSKVGGPDLNWNSTYASNYIVQKQFDRAKKKYEDALGYDPYHVQTIYNYADFYKNALYPPRFEESVKLYGRLTNRWPDNFNYLDKIGTTEIEWGDRTGDAGKYSNANDLYESYVSKPAHARHVDSYYRLLDVALRFKNSVNIDKYYDKIDFLNKIAVNVHTLTDLARYYIDGRRLDRAKLVFEKMMPVKPNYDEAYYEHGRYLTLNLDYYKAMIEVSNAIRLNGKNGKAYNLLGEIYYAYKGDSDTNSIVQAIKQFENSIDYTPNYYKPYANLGHIYFYNRLNFENPGDADEKAFEYYKTANLLLEKDKTDDLLSYNLGWLYYKYNDNANAFNEFSKLYVEDPHNPILSYNLGNIYYKTANYSFAKIEYDKAIEYYQAIADRIGYINPDLNRHKEIYSQLARSYNNRGVTYAAMAKKYRNDASEFDQNALLDFYRAKDNANKINVIYDNAEYNIKYMINRSIRKNIPALDNELVKRTTLQRFTEEFKQKMISNI
jgi:tetratricopeptide (TPR) repeat protein